MTSPEDCYDASVNADQCTDALPGLISFHTTQGHCFCCKDRMYTAASDGDQNWVTFVACNVNQDLQEQNDYLQEHNDELQDHNDDLQEQNDDLQEQNDNLQEQNDDLQEQVGNLQDQLGPSMLVRAAGANTYGELGVSDNSGNAYANPTPLQVTTLGTDVSAVSAGNRHTVYLMKDGSVRAAGANTYGELAGVSDNSGTHDPNPTPLEVTTLGTDVAAVSAGTYHTVYLMKNGSVRAAGYNTYGGLGVSDNSGTHDPNPTPLEVTALGKDVAAVSAGTHHTVYLMKNGSVRAAGYNWYGGLGVSDNSGSTHANPTPLEVTTLGTDVSAVSAGTLHTVYLMKDGSVRAAGRNRYGELGVSDNSGSTHANPTPLEVTTLGTDVSAVSAGGYHTVYLMKNGSVRAAGYNMYGELGVSDNSGSNHATPTPLEVTTLGTGVSAVSAGAYHTVYLMQDGSVRAAGRNIYGGLGVSDNSGSNHANPMPQEVTAVGAHAAAISAGGDHTVYGLVV
eukprot:TRINITY_DN7214_c0_g1_i7.p1 TRINITY_DN7214_c0_g1~~TRINITY_DN7214_c0_g1_i7.p1  ORF type:complete len:591 (-),score=110.96 TRINITY_DN7214_c0_g1_i7:126-1646(-)